jgi:hypothetical protein
MKNIKNLFLIGLIALAAVITFAGCPTEADDDNPFKGTWSTGNGQGGQTLLTFGDSTWELEKAAKGDYTRDGNTAALTATQRWNGSDWAPLSPAVAGTAIIDGNILTLTAPGLGTSQFGKQ